MEAQGTAGGGEGDIGSAIEGGVAAEAAIDAAGWFAFAVDTDGRVLWLGSAAAAAAGRSREEAVGAPLADLLPAPQGAAGVADLLARVQVAGTVHELDVAWVTPDGSVRVLAWSGARRTLAGRDVPLVVAVARDVTDRRAAEARLQFRAFHDPLTRIPNRALLIDRLRHAVSRLQRGRRLLAVVFVDLDDFKTVNDTHGHEAGDEVLQALAQRLRGAVRPSDTVARLGGDEFVVLCEDLEDQAAVENVTDRVVEALRAPYQVGDVEVVVRASVGVAVAAGPEPDPDDVLRRADRAMYRDKAARPDADDS